MHRLRPSKVHNTVTAGFISAALLLVIFAGPARADLQTGRVDLATGFNARIDGALLGDSSGYSVSEAGDVNGDGIDDVIVGAPMATYQSSGGLMIVSERRGSAYVIFGKQGSGTPPTTLDLLNMNRPDNTEGFRVIGAAIGDYAGASVSGVGDLNGDGLDDVIVGAPLAGNNFGETVLSPNPRSTGAAYVIYGKRDTGNVPLGRVGTPGNTEGFRMTGVAGESTMVGWSVDSAGDVNGDGHGDVIVGAPRVHFNGSGNTGSAYVVKGNPPTNNVALAQVGTDGNTDGFRLDGDSVGDAHADTDMGTMGAGSSVAGVGDLNGDGLDDVIVGAPSADYGGHADAGIANIVYGKQNYETVTATDVWRSGNEHGFQIIGASSGDLAGFSVSSAGDVNDDGVPDLIVGAPHADYNNSESSGSAYVILGKNIVDAPIKLFSVGAPDNNDGFRIDGPLKDYKVGWSVDAAGDVNNDGVSDLLVGTPRAYSSGLPGFQAGIAYLIHGKAEDTNTVDLTDVGRQGNADGVLIAGAAAGNLAGWSVAGAGDFNGDGGADVIVGAPLAGNNGRLNSGSSYIIYGTPPADPPPGGGEGDGGGGVPVETQAISGQQMSCAKVLYENRLEVSREIRLSDLVKGKGAKVYASASEASFGYVEIEINGREARQFKIYRRNSKIKSKQFASTKIKIDTEPKAVYLKAKGKEARLIRKALRLKRAPKRTKLKVSLVSQASANKRLERLNTQTIRALRRDKVKRTDTYQKIRQVLDKTDCGQPLRASIKGPRQTKLTVLTSKKAKRGRGTKVTVECSEDCTAKIGYRLWSRYEIGLKFRKKGQKMNRLLFKRNVKLIGGKPRTLRLGGVVSKKLRQLLVRGAKKKRYDRVKMKYVIEGRTADNRSAAGEGTSRVMLRLK